MKPAHLLLFWIMWYLAFSARALLSPFLPMIKNEFLFTNTTAGTLYLFVAAGGTLALLSAGSISLRLGYKRLITVGFILAPAALAGVFLADSYFSLAFCLFVFGVGCGFYYPCAIPLLTDNISRRHWGKAISFHETAAGFSLLSIPFLVAVILGYMPWRCAFVILSFVFLIACIIFWLVAPDTKPRQGMKIGIQTIIKRPDFWIILIIWAMNAIGAMGVYGVVPLFLVDERQMSIDSANQILSLSRVGGFSGQIIIGFFLDRYDSRKIISILMISSGLALLGMGLANTNLLIIIALFLQATFCTVFFPVGITAISRLTKPEERSYFTGIMMAISSGLAIGVAPVILGAIADFSSFQAGFLMLGVLTLGISFLARRL
ncbi:MAG: MFS transporter [Desulfobacteraceae bacterium]|nr:MFS transporter [Desulfobacteraceae bacterium]